MNNPIPIGKGKRKKTDPPPPDNLTPPPEVKRDPDALAAWNYVKPVLTAAGHWRKNYQRIISMYCIADSIYIRACHNADTNARAAAAAFLKEQGRAAGGALRKSQIDAELKRGHGLTNRAEGSKLERMNPAHKTLIDAANNLKEYAKELGLTPFAAAQLKQVSIFAEGAYFAMEKKLNDEGDGLQGYEPPTLTAAAHRRRLQDGIIKDESRDRIADLSGAGGSRIAAAAAIAAETRKAAAIAERAALAAEKKLKKKPADGALQVKWEEAKAAADKIGEMNEDALLELDEARKAAAL